MLVELLTLTPPLPAVIAIPFMVFGVVRSIEAARAFSALHVDATPPQLIAHASFFVRYLDNIRHLHHQGMICALAALARFPENLPPKIE